MITQTIKQIRNLAILVSLMIFCISCDDSTGVDQRKEDLKTEIFDKWLVTTECIETNGGDSLKAKTNQLWLFNKVPNTTEEAYFTIGLLRTKAKWTISDLYDFPHWVVGVTEYDEENNVTLGYIYDIVELSPMKGKKSVYFYSNDVKGWIFLSRYSIIGNRQSINMDK